MVPDRTRVGILGGTFDPPHLGHLAIATAVREALDLDEVLFVVANEPWQKIGGRLISPAADRLAMMQVAVAGRRGLRASSMEIERGGPSYTLDTLRELHRSEPSRSHFLIVGADAASLLHTWHRHEELPGLATLVIVDRPGAPPEVDPPGWEVVHVPGPGLEVSSSMVRDALAAGESVDHLVPASVLTQIHRRGLYDAGRS
jgi:nicotinate-nucleotide adenylyltransferase